jgi:uncharacterized protein YdiU (UPF0061 family)
MNLTTTSYLKLPELFYERVLPTPVGSPSLVALNEPLAERLGIGIDAARSPEFLALFSGNAVATGTEPVALAYSGHQFGHFVPVLGDGRAILLGEVRAADGARFDLQLKGSGKTGFSRRGDGRAALGPMMREYIIGEALYHLGIPATRTLAVVATGEKVLREALVPGGIQTRVANGHIRVGSFQYAAAHGDFAAIKALADYVIGRNYPELEGVEDRYYELVTSIFKRQAALVAQWMQVGFIHGVMNTDNVAVSGESIDFGPCAFMNSYEPNTVFSSIDRDGRYSYGAQPGVMMWNLTRLVESVMPLLDSDSEHARSRAQELVDLFPGFFNAEWLSGIREKLGLVTSEAGDEALIQGLLEEMAKHALDYTTTFRALSGDPHFILSEKLSEWRLRWESRIVPARNQRAVEETLASMRSMNPALIARNRLVEEALEHGVERGDFTYMHRLVEALKQPFVSHAEFAAAASFDEPGYRTFCGT